MAKYKEEEARKIAESVWNKLLSFAGYGFNKSHAAAYTIMGYWSQWFKVNYPLEFWTTSLQFATEAEVPYRLAEMKKTGVDIEIRPPDVNYSEKNFTCDAGEQRIFFSINKIKQVGDVAVENILKTREEGGRFFSLEEFCSRVPKKVNKRIIVHLIIAGAFDMIEDIRNPRERRKLLQQYLESKGDKLPEAYRGEEAQTNAFWILEQKKLTGFGEIDYESMIRESIPNKRVAKMYVNDIEFLVAKENDEVTIAGRLMYYHENETKNGTMCGMQIDCNNTIIYFTAWPDFYKDIKDEMEDIKGCLIAVCGTVKKDKFKGDKRVYSNNGTRLFIINSKID
jgi:DNA polymerase-3 subunit alpha